MSKSHDEHIKITINEHSCGLEHFVDAEYKDITITLKNYNVSTNKDFVEEYIEDYYIELISKGLRKPIRKNIEKIYFYKVFEQINTLDFYKIYEENDSGCDGWILKIKMDIQSGLINYCKKIKLWCPKKNSKMTETGKILQIVENIRKEIYYNNYYKIIESIIEIENY